MFVGPEAPERPSPTSVRLVLRPRMRSQAEGTREAGLDRVLGKDSVGTYRKDDPGPASRSEGARLIQILRVMR
jgi:hypothetical protein